MTSTNQTSTLQFLFSVSSQNYSFLSDDAIEKAVNGQFGFGHSNFTLPVQIAFIVAFSILIGKFFACSKIPIIFSGMIIIYNINIYVYVYVYIYTYIYIYIYIYITNTIVFCNIVNNSYSPLHMYIYTNISKHITNISNCRLINIVCSLYIFT